MLIADNIHSQSSCVGSREARGPEAGNLLTLAQHCASAFLQLPPYRSAVLSWLCCRLTPFTSMALCVSGGAAAVGSFSAEHSNILYYLQALLFTIVRDKVLHGAAGAVSKTGHPRQPVSHRHRRPASCRPRSFSPHCCCWTLFSAWYMTCGSDQISALFCCFPCPPLPSPSLVAVRVHDFAWCNRWPLCSSAKLR